MALQRSRILHTILRLKSPSGKFSNFRIAFYSTQSRENPKNAYGEHFGLPSLNESLEKYLSHTKSLVSPKQWKNTCKITKEFLKSPEGTQLQDMLQQRAKMEDNWLFDWWLSSYLNSREPIVVHSNPAVRMKIMNFHSDEQWLVHAAYIIQGALNFKHKLENKSFDQESDTGNSPLCTAQYYAILGNCRIPGTPNDRLFSRRGDSKTTVDVEHICVLYRNRLYTLNYMDTVSRVPVSLGTIYLQLEHIVHLAQQLPPAPPIGLLTSLPRDDWAEIHSYLRQNFQNANNFSALEHSLFVLCLDDSANLPPTEQPSESNWEFSERDTVSALNILHGNLINSGNRWFDKTIALILSRDGSLGIHFEHTPADAGVHAALAEEIYATLEQPFARDSRLPKFSQPVECTWELTSETEAEIERARDLLKQLVESMDAQYANFRTFGSSALKNLQMSPDAFFQVALQLAYARLHPDLLPPPTYESGSLRRFHLGRTDTIRSCSQETVKFTKAMANPRSAPGEQAELLRQAIDEHRRYTKETTSGQAFDRHLLGLRLLSDSLKSSHPDIYERTQILFNDPTYREANHYRLSTSQVRSETDLAVIFGPVVPDGYGLCYNIHPDHIQMNATAFRSSNDTRSPRELLEHLFTALEDMMKLCKNSPS